LRLALERSEARYPKARYPSGHPELARCLNNLAVLYQNMGDYAKAEPLLRQALEITKRALGEHHPNYAQSLNNLAGLYDTKGDYAKAEPLYRRALEIRKRALGEDHPDTLNTMNNLAATYLMAQRCVEAEMTARECLELRAKNQPDDWRRFHTMGQLGAALAGQKKYAGAEPPLLQGYEGLKAREDKIPAPRRRDLADAAARIGPFYEAWGKKNEADKWRTKLKPAVDITKPRP